MKLSIVMPSFNQVEFIAAALRSVLDQSCDDCEVIVIDGGSTDGSLDVIASFRDRLTHVVSEPDEGQSHALEKGFSLAKGEFLTWLNSDDLLMPGAISSVFRALDDDRNCDWILGNVALIDRDGWVLCGRKGAAASRFWQKFGVFTAAGPSAFFSRRLYEKVGGINRSLHYKMDTDLWWRFLLSGAQYWRLEGYTWGLRLHSQAKTSAHLFQPRDDPRTQLTLAVQRREQQAIEALMAQAGVAFPKLAKAAGRVHRGLSPSFYKSLRDTRRFSGRHVEDVFGRLK